MKKIIFILLVLAVGMTFTACSLDSLDTPEINKNNLGGGDPFQMTDSIFYVSSKGAELETTILNHTSFHLGNVRYNDKWYHLEPKAGSDSTLSCPLLDAKIEKHSIKIHVKENGEKQDLKIVVPVVSGNVFGYIIIYQEGNKE